MNVHEPFKMCGNFLVLNCIGNSYTMSTSTLPDIYTLALRRKCVYKVYIKWSFDYPAIKPCRNDCSIRVFYINVNFILEKMSEALYH